MTVQAIWNGTVLAESDQTIVVEGNHYFPPDSINKEHFRRSAHTSMCFWKGQASYYDVEVDGHVNRNAAWYYPSPSDAARQIKGHVAFWNGVRVKEMTADGREPGPGSVKRLLARVFG